MKFPSQFMLVAAMNPTPDAKVPAESRCSPREIQNYLNRISGPLLDRIDIHVAVPEVNFREITAERTGEASAKIHDRVVAAIRNIVSEAVASAGGRFVGMVMWAAKRGGRRKQE